MTRRSWVRAGRRLAAGWLALGLSVAACATKTVVVEAPAGDAPAAARALTTAYRELGPDGGTIVLHGTLRLPERFAAPANTGLVTLTRRSGGGDGAEDGARLVVDDDYAISGPTRFTDLTLEAGGRSARFSANGHHLEFDRSVVCRPDAASQRYPRVAGAASGGAGAAGADLVINGGTWDLVTGGSPGSHGATGGTLRVVINGGVFHGVVCAAGPRPHVGDADLTLNDGEFLGGVAGSGAEAAGGWRGDLRVTIRGGRFHHRIAAAGNPASEARGSYTLALHGGAFGSVTDLIGTERLRGGATSSLLVGPRVDLAREETGEVTFANPLVHGADPWVFTDRGYYYGLVTGGTRLHGYKVTNLADLRTAPPIEYWQPPTGRAYSKNLWSPKIYHLTADEVGADLAGWYLYVAADDGDNANHRQYVLRALTDDPLGPYGSVDEHQLNVPTPMASDGDRSCNREWSVGGKLLRHGGRLYFVWVGRVGGKYAPEHWQCLYIARLKNPWTITGHPVPICRPTLDWEKHGAGVAANGIRYPEVVEGGIPVTNESGKLFLIYSGSGYWTPYYALGQMELVGSNPLDPADWRKGTTPIFRASREVNGTGNASFVPSPRGRSHWAVYHAYVGRKSPQNGRRLFAEPCVIGPDGLTVGSGQPLPLGTPLTMEVNPMPLRDKISGFSACAATGP